MVGRKSLLRFGLVLPTILFLVSAREAQAYVGLTLVDVRPVGNVFEYTYAVTLSAGTMLTSAGGGPNTGFSPSNNFFTLYDVQGFVPGSVTCGGALGIAGFVADAEGMLGDDPPGEVPNPPDDPAVPNITIYWTGPDIAAFEVMDICVGTLSFQSANPLGGGQLAYTAATQLLDGFPDVPANNFSLVAGPNGSVLQPGS